MVLTIQELTVELEHWMNVAERSDDVAVKNAAHQMVALIEAEIYKERDKAREHVDG